MDGLPTGGMPAMNDPKAMEQAAKALGQQLPGLGGPMGGLPGGLSGFGKKK
jgi:signal recognition particle subunit SRP54